MYVLRPRMQSDHCSVNSLFVNLCLSDVYLQLNSIMWVDSGVCFGPSRSQLAIAATPAIKT